MASRVGAMLGGVIGAQVRDQLRAPGLGICGRIHRGELQEKGIVRAEGPDGQGGRDRAFDAAGNGDHDPAAVQLVAHDGAHALADPVCLRFAVEVDDLFLVSFCQGCHWLYSICDLLIRSKTFGVLRHICEAYG